MNEEISAGDLTGLISSWRGGRTEALGDLVSAAYPKLRGIAEAFLRKEAHAHTLQATGLVNELYLVLRQQRTVSMVSRSDFFSFAAYLIRLILLNSARQRTAEKRGGGAARVPLTEELSWIDAAGEDMIDLSRALDELAGLDERKVKSLELTAFLGCSNEEAADLLGISRATLERDLRFTRAWLFERLKSGR